MSIGEMLRKTREDKGISLTDVENETKIRRRYIVALEEEDYDVLPEKVYIKGFLKNYARFLGLDGTALVNEYESLHAQPDVEPIVEPPASTKSYKQAPNPSRRGLVAVVAVLLLGAVIYWWGTSGAALRDDLSAGEREQYGQAGEEYGAENGETDANENNAPEGEEQWPDSTQLGVNVVLEVTDRDCWMEVDVDNHNVYQGLARPGEIKQFQGENIVRLKLGDAGAVRVLVNGNDYGFLGGQGVVVEESFEAGENSGNVAGG